ncbi:hypothetical protein R3P38DRAFT_3444435 [Favolaschia claudopus]|uniref:BED-type domain-containing protein n=1 Tax=Favolaschia claudopus TaxID=2862362 RepID=A0AAV9ZPP3_9AGAR
MATKSSADDASTEGSDSEIVLDDELFAICPACKERVHCGPSGINNLLKRHKGSAACLAAKAKRKKGKKSKLKDTPILSWLRPKAARVPSTVTAPPPIITSAVSTRLPSSSASSRSRFSSASLLGQLEAAISTLPNTIKEATNQDILAAFAGEPSLAVPANVPAVEIYEHLNPMFHRTLGWNMSVEDTAQLLRRGEKGLRGLLNFIAYFVEVRGVSERDFAAKIQQVLDAIHFL